MTERMGERRYMLRTGNEKPPQYTRTVRALSDRDVIEEIALGRGDAGYQQALRDAATDRGLDTE